MTYTFPKSVLKYEFQQCDIFLNFEPSVLSRGDMLKARKIYPKKL